MFCYDCEKREVEIGSTVKVKGLIGTLTEILTDRIVITVSSIARIELAYAECGRWYSTMDKCKSPRMYLSTMSDYSMENGKLYFADTSSILPGNEVQIPIDGKQIWVRAIAQTAITMHWKNNEIDVDHVTFSSTQDDPCMVLLDDLGRSYYAVYVEDDDYQATQLYTNRNGEFVRLEQDLNWRFE
ncbi:hypothetical protein phiAS5_ORF0178 [Aeromonas phage phiAS5]|uniref:Uncharacterized protein n=1 Tax=Aeromonas phage phiAS5 TaxID=879630 RepID=E1A2S5_9CAUD|nr:hypothetical protein phiAS5_ORF0178 [Aeromonas phage phiAS5]ADM80021.1 hypothetical protein phiAS5_ORF0178 [Aeromonas phage phiAS5]